MHSEAGGGMGDVAAGTVISNLRHVEYLNRKLCPKENGHEN